MNLEKTNLKAIVSDGYIVMYKNVSICDLCSQVEFVSRYSSRLYQVHSDNSKHKMSETFKNIDEAVNKFLEVKSMIR